MTPPRGPARPAGLAGLASIASLALAACGTAAPGGPGGPGTEHPTGGGCKTTVHGVIASRGALTAHWLPEGFTLAHDGRSTSALPSATYHKASDGTNQPRLQLAVSYHQAPLSRGDTGGQPVVRSVLVQGHRALLGSGLPGPTFTGLYFKPSNRFLITVVGYRLPAATVLQAARHVSFAPPGTISLPIAPGPIVARSAAVAAARRSGGASWRRADAKLSSWTETATMLAAHTGRDPAKAPAALAGAPWGPVWSVLLTGRNGSPGRSALIVVTAAAGKPVYAAAAGPRWFAALTDRDPHLSARCPGGSSARLPFGVLTRTEVRYADGWRPTHVSGGARQSIRLVLSTVRAINRADPGMYGGCVRQDCSLGELVWVTITTSRAEPGHRLQCLPPSASYPPGYRPRHVRQMFSASVPDNYEIGCGAVPPPLRKLRDLAPALGGPAAHQTST